MTESVNNELEKIGQKNIVGYLDDWLTVHHSITLVLSPT
jgi:hypothetical protein